MDSRYLLELAWLDWSRGLLTSCELLGLESVVSVLISSTVATGTRLLAAFGAQGAAAAFRHPTKSGYGVYWLGLHAENLKGASVGAFAASSRLLMRLALS